MNRFAVSILAVALVAATGTASAQNSSAQGRPFPAPANDRYMQTTGPYYDEARVVRVDPVLQSGYGNTETSSGRCYSDDDVYADNGENRNDDRYSDRRYDDRSPNSQGTETGRNVATVLGGIVGAALGSKIGGGSARYATAAVGSMVGGMAGRGIYETSQRNRQPKPRITVCDPVREGSYSNTGSNVTAYDVTYEYAGRQYVTRTDYHPGDHIRVRVDVRPE
jgi:outer membrane lipoprotein SlyB